MKSFLSISLMKYFAVGGMAALIDFGIFACLNGVAHWHWFPAALVSFIAATLINYYLSIGFVFKSGARYNKRRHEVFATFLISVAGLCVNQATLWVCIHSLQMHPLAAKIAGTGLVFFWNYGARRYFVFNEVRR